MVSSNRTDCFKLLDESFDIVENHDLLSSENNYKLMLRNRYQNVLKKTFYQDENSTEHRRAYLANRIKKPDMLIREDWKCFLQKRHKFLPDFETIEKRSIKSIRKVIEFNFHYRI